DEEDLTESFAGPFGVEENAPEYSSPELSWVESSADNNEAPAEVAAPVEEAETEADQDGSATELPPSEFAKAIDVVFAEKGIVEAEDDSGIPSELLQRLNSSDPNDRE